MYCQSKADNLHYYNYIVFAGTTNRSCHQPRKISCRRALDKVDTLSISILSAYYIVVYLTVIMRCPFVISR